MKGMQVPIVWAIVLIIMISIVTLYFSVLLHNRWRDVAVGCSGTVANTESICKARDENCAVRQPTEYEIAKAKAIAERECERQHRLGLKCYSDYPRSPEREKGAEEWRQRIEQISKERCTVVDDKCVVSPTFRCEKIKAFLDNRYRGSRSYGAAEVSV